MHCDGGRTNERSQKTPIEHETVATGFKGNSDEKEVKAMLEEIVKTLGMKEEKYMIDCPATLVTHDFDRYARGANMRQHQMNGRAIEIQPALKAEDRFQWKRLG